MSTSTLERKNHKPALADPDAAAREAIAQVESALRDDERDADAAPADYITELQKPIPDPVRLAALARRLGRSSKALADDIVLAKKISAANRRAQPGPARTDAERAEIRALSEKIGDAIARRDAANIEANKLTAAREAVEKRAYVRQLAAEERARFTRDLRQRLGCSL